MLLGVRLAFPKIDGYLLAQNGASLLGAVIIAPLIEEVVFRGVIFTQLTKHYNLKVGLWGSALIFGAVHLMNGSLDWISAIQLVIAGTVMGMLLNAIYIKEKNIWASFTVHALYNMMGSLVPIGNRISPDWFMQLILKNNNRLLTGGECGIDCSLINISAYLIVMIIIVYRYKKKESLNGLTNRANTKKP